MKVYDSLRQFTKVTIFHNIFSVKSLAFVPFCLLAMQFLHFVISYDDERNFPVCYRSVSPLDNIGKYFAIVKLQVIFPISQILSNYISPNHNEYSRATVYDSANAKAYYRKLHISGFYCIGPRQWYEILTNFLQNCSSLLLKFYQQRIITNVLKYLHIEGAILGFL